jgi:hypothetical protein
MNLATIREINAYDHARSPYPWSFNEYSELRTIPTCWTLEAVKATVKPSSNGHGKPVSAVPDSDPSATVQENHNADEAILEWHRNRFLDSIDTTAYWALTW